MDKGGVSIRTRGPGGSRLGGPTLIGEGNDCKGVDCEIPHSLGGNQTPFIKVWKPPTNRLAPEKEKLKESTPRRGRL